ncbi:hypothetical protein H6F42_05885 [Pseudanabaena sp. FACHB-1998]|uniref:hypothetical protein n=1 Tax=Pseudanabaena sp. FACHB-1998 TaxID=2692858 RepID=UPI0016809DB5|nr:hypothetical protein [Pseudanabaena sp. FACHB-1998]MBD2176446.1 hypothetical protein [Pseudanabaena sp. FACHB-1998]
MSTKKKVGISDLLRDEAQKGSDSAIAPENTDKTIEVKAEIVTDTVSKAPSQSVTSQALMSAEDRNSKAKIASLELALTQSQQKETELLQTITDLQKDLKFSQTNMELLQKSLAAIESLKSELDQQLVEVKRDNLRLAEANIQLSEQLKSLETVQAPEVVAPTSSQLVSQNPQNNRATPRKQPVEQPYPQRDRNPYHRPTGSNEQLQKINNKNIGWMD